ncbi:MAG TPA: tetratricopeptide repeat protein [Bryobacteraceae bacterium]|nr:tetratricopeptide repeat protein [Bryobacteraceae bacterium]
MAPTVMVILALLTLQAPVEVPGVDWKAEIEKGNKAIAARDYAEGTARFRSALAQLETAPGEDAGVLAAIRGCATGSRLQGHGADAEQYLSRAVVVAVRLHGDASLEVAALLSELAAVQRSNGRRQEALTTLQSAVRIRQSRTDGKAEDLARDITGVAILQVALGDAKFAEETLKQALTAWEAAVAPDSPQLLPVLDALGGIHQTNADYEKAEPLYLRALRVREAALGPDSSELLSTLDSLAYVYFGQKKFSEAEPVYKRLLALWESSAGLEHPMVALTLDKMAEFYAFQQRYEEAEKAASAALTIRTTAHIASLNQVGRVLLMEAKLGEAEDLYHRAIGIGDLAKAPDEMLDPLLRIYAKVLRAGNRLREADTVDKRIKDALLRKADREGRRPSPVKPPVGQ